MKFLSLWLLVSVQGQLTPDIIFHETLVPDPLRESFDGNITLLVWNKLRETIAHHFLQDASRGNDLIIYIANLLVPYDWDHNLPNNDDEIENVLLQVSEDLQSACDDTPLGWTDKAGNGCTVYASTSGFCGASFVLSDNYGVDASRACCVCGGGTSSDCEDFPEWRDIDGVICAGYHRFDNDECLRSSDYRNEDGHDARHACCICGGGTPTDSTHASTSGPTHVPVPMSALTNDTTSPPTSVPMQGCRDYPDWIGQDGVLCPAYVRLPESCSDEFAINDDNILATEACCACQGRSMDEHPTDPPTTRQTRRPMKQPKTQHPTQHKTKQPTQPPTPPPTHLATQQPTQRPTLHPTGSPTKYPTGNPTQHPTKNPTQLPSDVPTGRPTQPESCSNPGVPHSNSRICHGQHSGGLCEFDCDEGYEKSSPSTAHCNHGIWENLPQCQVRYSLNSIDAINFLNRQPFTDRQELFFESYEFVMRNALPQVEHPTELIAQLTMELEELNEQLEIQDVICGDQYNESIELPELYSSSQEYCESLVLHNLITQRLEEIGQEIDNATYNPITEILRRLDAVRDGVFSTKVANGEGVYPDWHRSLTSIQAEEYFRPIIRTFENEAEYYFQQLQWEDSYIDTPGGIVTLTYNELLEIAVSPGGWYYPYWADVLRDIVLRDGFVWTKPPDADTCGCYWITGEGGLLNSRISSLFVTTDLEIEIRVEEFIFQQEEDGDIRTFHSGAANWHLVFRPYVIPDIVVVEAERFS